MSEQLYKLLLEHVLQNGHIVKDRTGVGTKSIFGATIACCLS